MSHRAEAIFEGDPASVRAAREFVEATLAAWDLDDLAEVAALCTSEVTTNAIRHARSAFRLSVEARASELVVEVEDRGDGEPSVLLPEFETEGGRGMWMVTAMTARWGWEKLVGGGKVVWFSLSTLGPHTA